MPTPATSRPDASRDFDFLLGTWTTRQRRLKARLQGCTEWESFSAQSRVQRLPGGVINFDTLEAEAWRPGWVGMSIRIFNPQTQLWSIYWATNDGAAIDPASGCLGPPVVGGFQGDEGLFEGRDVCEGRPIRVRFRWQRLGRHAARWEQSFSCDDGGTWEMNWEMLFERLDDAREVSADGRSVPAADIDCQVVELRRYTLHPGRREALITLFERAFVESQEAAGMAVMGQFRDLDAPDHFVWLRGFADMDARARGLAAFYGGPVWQRHRDEANATMVAFDDVLLLRPAWPGAGIAMRGRSRAAGAVRLAPPAAVQLSILALRDEADAALLTGCREVLAPCLQRAGAELLGCYVREHAANNFPQLPVRTGAPVLVVVALFASQQALDAFQQGGAWAREVAPALAPWLAAPAECHRLQPTARSAIGA